MAAHVHEELGDSVALVLDGGPCAVGIESTILDLSRDDLPPRLLRPGHITPEQIEAVIGVMPELPSTMRPVDKGAAENATPRVSGSLDAHYAPLTPMRVVASKEVAAVLQNYLSRGVSFGLLAYGRPPALVQTHALRCLPADPDGYARGLYAALRELDQAGNEVIVVEAIPVGPAWAAVADRMRRAECGSGAV